MDFGGGMTEDPELKKRSDELAAEKAKQEQAKLAEESAKRAGLRGARSLISRAYGDAGAGAKSDSLG